MNENRELPSAGCVIFVIVAIVAVIAGGTYWLHWDRVDPGNAGVKINYCDSTSETITDSRYVWVSLRCEKLVEYPLAEYTLEMVNLARSGAQAPDNSVPCVMKDQQTINMDSATAWSVDPGRVADLYRLRPNIPLTGGANGNDIATLIVRSEVRAGIRDACTGFGWEEAYGPRRADYESAAEKAVQARLQPVGITVRTVSIRDMDPSPALDSLIAARLEGQKQVESARFQQEQAARQGEAQVAQQRAAGLVQAEQSKAALEKAKADAEQLSVQTASEAARTKALAQAEAEANAARSGSLTPLLVELERWRKWDGRLPTTAIGGDQPVSVPLAPR